MNRSIGAGRNGAIFPLASSSLFNYESDVKRIINNASVIARIARLDPAIPRAPANGRSFLLLLPLDAQL